MGSGYSHGVSLRVRSDFPIKTTFRGRFRWCLAVGVVEKQVHLEVCDVGRRL